MNEHECLVHTAACCLGTARFSTVCAIRTRRQALPARIEQRRNGVKRGPVGLATPSTQVKEKDMVSDQVTTTSHPTPYPVAETGPVGGESDPADPGAPGDSAATQTAGAAPRLGKDEHEMLLALGFPAQADGHTEEPQRPHSAEQEPCEPIRPGLRERLRGATKARLGQLSADERGAVTAEYALVIMAAVAFAGLLIVIMRSDEVRAMLLSLVQNALGSAG